MYFQKAITVSKLDSSNPLYSSNDTESGRASTRIQSGSAACTCADSTPAGRRCEQSDDLISMLLYLHCPIRRQVLLCNPVVAMEVPNLALVSTSCGWITTLHAEYYKSFVMQNTADIYSIFHLCILQFVCSSAFVNGIPYSG